LHSHNAFIWLTPLQVINTMMDQLQIFSSEVSRVAREVGTEGILGGQAQIVGVDGTWKELTNNGEHLLGHSKSILPFVCPFNLPTAKYAQ
jgi:hypothetical protein